MALTRRNDRLGIHSIGEFHLTVPSLAEAESFYGTFGLRVARGGEGLTLRAGTSEHVWGRVFEGARKRLQGLVGRIQREGGEMIETEEATRNQGIWFRDPDGLRICVRPGVKTTPDDVIHVSPPLPTHGARCAPYRSLAQAVLPTRLSHIARITPSVSNQVAFYERALGLRLSDRSGDGVAFMHAPHGSDHHLVAFAHGEGHALHHLSWDVPTVEDVGAGMTRMRAAGYTQGWGLGRHVLGSNYFYYARDPWGSFCEFSATMDYIPASCNWEAKDHPPEDSMYLWGPDIPPEFLENSEADR